MTLLGNGSGADPVKYYVLEASMTVGLVEYPTFPKETYYFTVYVGPPCNLLEIGF